MRMDIPFEKDLFKAADKLRGIISPSDYKYFVLPLIFLRFLSIKADKRRKELIKLFDGMDLSSDSNNKMFEDKINDESEYSKVNTLYIPQNCSWAYLEESVNSNRENVVEIIDSSFYELQKTHPTLLDFELLSYKESDLPLNTFNELIILFSNEIFSTNTGDIDLLGRTYEYFISNFASSEGIRGGEFFTPSSVVKLLVDMLDIKDGIVFDPACGTGGMFIQSNNYNSNSSLIFIGQELNKKTISLAKMNALLHNINPTIIQGDSLLNDKFPDLKADYVISNPPFNMKEWGGETISLNDPRVMIKVNKSNANYMWIQHFYYHLKESGNAGFVIANGALTSSIQNDKDIRKKLIDLNAVDCIVQLPDKMFFSTAIPSALMFLTKREKSKDDTERHVLFIDASKMGTLLNKRQRVFSDNEINQITELYQRFKRGETISLNRPGFAKAVPYSDIRKQDYKFLPSAFIDLQEKVFDTSKNQQELIRLRTSVKELFKESNTIQDRLLALWGKSL